MKSVFAVVPILSLINTAQASERWNAIAAVVGKTRTGIHTASGWAHAPSQNEAKRTAISECGKSCHIVAAWNSGCLYISLATGNTANGAAVGAWGTGHTRGQADAQARTSLINIGGDHNFDVGGKDPGGCS